MIVDDVIVCDLCHLAKEEEANGVPYGWSEFKSPVMIEKTTKWIYVYKHICGQCLRYANAGCKVRFG